MATKKKEAVEEIKGEESKSILDSILKEHNQEHFNYQERISWNVSTGSLLLDLGVGGLKPGLWRFCGGPNLGKTPLMLECIRNLFEGVENSKALWMIAEGRNVSRENQERCGLKFVYSASEWDNHTVFVLESNIFEVVIKIIKELVLNNPQKTVFGFAIDSLDGLITRNDAKKEIEESSQVAGKAVLSKKMMQSLSLGMFKNGHVLLASSQQSAEIKLDMYGPKTPNRGGNFSGGSSLLHISDYILSFENAYNTDFILDSKSDSARLNDGKSKPIGHYVKVTLAKSEKEAYRKVQITFPVKNGRKPSGIWREREVADCLVMWGFLAKSGSWFSFTDEVISKAAEDGIIIPTQKNQGMDSVYKFLEETPEVCDYFYNLFLKMMAA